jgi:signal transduction histidine kinase
VRFAGLFDAERRYLTGNLANFPENFEPNGEVQSTVAARREGDTVVQQTVHAVGAQLSNGNYYVIARNFDDFVPQQQSMMFALAQGLLPATLLALLAGALLSLRTERRIAEIHRMAQRIMAGHLNERLPSRGSTDDFDKLVSIINTMLDQIEHLMAEVKGVGDDIAHDLRTPLTRVRAALERGRENAASLEDLRATVDKGLTGIDQALGVTTALLRIAAIEHGQRTDGFGEVDLGEIVAAIVELYEPAAEDKGVKLFSGGITNLILRGDRDLLFEAISNLVDNAIKFTPKGGTVTIELVRTDDNLLLRVADTGPGIPLAEREAVFRRFYRSDKSRNLTGMGLGLSLVAAISRLHGFQVQVADSMHGCTIEMICSPVAS